MISILARIRLLATAFTALALAPLVARADAAADVRAFTGAPTRMVWIQDAGPVASVYSEHPTIRLMGFDTEDGKGERPILPDIGWYGKPLLTSDGNRVVFANLADHSVEVVNFDGTGRRQILKNDNAYKYDPKPFIDDAVWTDPKSGVTWVYAMDAEQRGATLVPVIRRWQLDHPEVSQLIWDKTPLYMFMLSGDGRVASGGTVDGGNSGQGVFTLPNGTFMMQHNGCWPSIAPDASHRMWVFQGNHRGILLHTPINRTGSMSALGFMFPAPGLNIDSGDETYHPRWSNNVHFMAMDAPFPHKAWNFKSDAKIPIDVAANVEIYIGKFKDDFTGIERWIQVTHNKVGDYWPNVWIKPSAEDLAALAKGSDAPIEKAPATLDQRGLAYIWQTEADGNQIADPRTGALRQCSGQLHGQARFGRYSVMDLTDGTFVPDNAAGPVLAACKAGNQFALETEITPTGPAPSGEKIIMAFADDPEKGNFVLAQDGSALNLHLKTDQGPLPPPAIHLCDLVQDQTTHLVISYANGSLAAYVNGKPATVSATAAGGLSNWTPQPLIFGDAAKGGQNWTGLMEDVAIFSRAIGASEARERFLKQRERISTRKPIDTVVVDAKLVTPCAGADPKGIAPYRRCLSIQLYEVEKVISGTCPDQKISVAQWSVLDAQVVAAYTRLAVGQTYRLILEKMDDHPEQESERSASGDFDPTNLVYYQVRAPDVTPLTLGAPSAGETAGASTFTGSLATAVPGTTILTNPAPADLESTGSQTLAGQGAVVGATVIDPGFDYTDAPTSQITGGGGKGATGEAVMGIAAPNVTDLGGGYTSEPTVTITPPEVPGGRQAQATAQIDKAGGSVSGITIADSGTGYLHTPQVTFSGGGGTGATAEVGLVVSGLVITNGGSGYTSAPDITFDGGGGQHAAALGALQTKTFRFTNPGGNATFTNSGTLDQDASALIFDYAATQRPTTRIGFDNKGTWTLENGARVQFTSTSGHPDWIGDGTQNSGTLSVLDHSRLGFSMLMNTGTLTLGAGAVLGQSEFAEKSNSLVNSGNGIVKVIGSTPDQPTIFGLIAPDGSGARTISNLAPHNSGHAQFIIGSGTDSSTFIVTGGQVDVTNDVGGSMEIQSGATLALLSDNTGSTLPPGNSTSRIAKLTNVGDLRWEGLLRTASNQGALGGVDNTGKLTLHGDHITAEKMPNAAGPGSLYETRFAMQILNRGNGIVQGIGTLNYTNSTGSSENRFFRIFNQATLAPGEAADGSTPETYGALVLKDTNVRFGAFVLPPRLRGSKGTDPDPAPVAAAQPKAGILQIGIAGPPSASDRFDSLTLTGTGDVGQLEFVPGDNNTLNIVAAANVTPHGTYRIATATTIVGTFDTLQYNGATPAPYTINYLPNAIEVTFP